MYRKKPPNSASALPKRSPGRPSSRVAAMPATGAAASMSSQRSATERSPPFLMHDVHRVDAVGEIVREHRDGDDETHRVRGLECEPDRDAVEQAVCGQHQRADAAPRGASRRGSAACGRARGRQEIRARSSQNAPPRTRHCAPISMASGSKSKNATPITAPALNPRIKCSLSRSPSASNPPARVLTKAAMAMARAALRFFHA